MAKRDVSPDSAGKHVINGKGGRNLSLEFADGADKDRHIVEELSDNDIIAKIPTDKQKTPGGASITWFAGFNVFKKVNGQKGDYADNVNYDVSLEFESSKQYWAYDGQLREVTSELSSNKKIRFSKGDPAVGSVP